MSDLKTAADALAPDLVRWRRDLHRHPELGFEVHRTAAFVHERLTALEIETEVGVARTGVIGILRAARRDGPGILMRADMDALPIQEVEGRTYGSQIPGRMHACGHDAHTAMLLGAATLLARRRQTLRRDILFMFQPAEEGGGGAPAMLAAGLLDRLAVAEAYALHLWTPFPAGTVQLRPGPIMASQDEFTARILGKGGHGALPHQANDSIVAAAMGILALQTVVSRHVDPVQPAVVSVGSIHAGSAPNVIPDVATFDGTLRSFVPEVRQIVRDAVKEILEHAAATQGCRLELDLRPGYPAVVNDPAAVERVRAAGARSFGKDAVVTCPPLAAAEDFSYVLERVPGAFVLVGAGNPAKGIDAPHHSPRFDIDESVLPRGAELLARLALEA